MCYRRNPDIKDCIYRVFVGFSMCSGSVTEKYHYEYIWNYFSLEPKHVGKVVNIYKFASF